MFPWPEFPDDRPVKLRDKLVVAWVAYSSSIAGRGKAECHMSIRHLVMRFSLSSQSVAEAYLKRLTRRMPNGSSGWKSPLQPKVRAATTTGSAIVEGRPNVSGPTWARRFSAPAACSSPTARDRSFADMDWDRRDARSSCAWSGWGPLGKRR